MRSVKSGLMVVALVATGVGAMVVGCSADGSNDVTGDQPVPSGTVDQNQPTPPTNPPPSGGVDAGKPKDAGRDTSTVTDARPDVRDATPDTFVATEYPEGTSCTTANQTNTVGCGLCGTKSQVCLPSADGGLAWTATGFCQNEVVGGCQPGATRSTACGLCGTQTDTCQNNCRWPTSGTCTGQPANACNPGAKEFAVGLGCTQGPNSGRERVCDTACQWGNYGNCQAGPQNPNIINVPALNATASTKYTLAANATQPKPPIGSCPIAGNLGAQTPTTCVEVKNNNATNVTVSIWNSTPTGGTSIDTEMTAYNGPVIPTTDPARKNCVGTVTDTCNTSPCETGQYDWAGMTSTMSPPSPVQIAANNSVIICTASYFSSDVGDFMLNVRREQ